MQEGTNNRCCIERRPDIADWWVGWFGRRGRHQLAWSLGLSVLVNIKYFDTDCLIADSAFPSLPRRTKARRLAKCRRSPNRLPPTGI
jgi:hypothetical protein